MNIAVLFFGITRALSVTVSSIERNVLLPARSHGNVSVYAHFFRQDLIANPRSQEYGRMNIDDYRLLLPDWLELEEPDSILEDLDFNSYKQYGDRWGDNFISLRNLFHQLHSLRRVTRAALEDGPDIFLFARPDLQYHDNLKQSLAKATKAALRGETRALIPNWQSKGKRLNDRFAICVGQDAAAAYGNRLDILKLFCESHGMAPQPESLVKFALDEANVPVSLIRARASRVRVDGREVQENFTPKLLSEIRDFGARILLSKRRRATRRSRMI